MARPTDPLETFFWGAGGQPMTEEEIARQREIAEALIAGSVDTSPVGHWTQGAARLANAVVGRVKESRANRAEAGNADYNRSIIESLFAPSGGSTGPAASAPAPGGPPTPATSALMRGTGGSSLLPPSMQAALDRTEGGGSYDTLFGHAQREGGPFAGTAISAMPIKDVLRFQDPSGPYAQYVKNKVGRVATPAGRHQIVGTTLRRAVAELGLDPNTPFDQNTQDTIALHLAKRRVQSADSLDGKISALRSEWEGFKSVPTAQMAQIVAEIEGAPMSVARAPVEAAPVQVASLDPSIGVPEQQTAGLFVGTPDQMPPEQAPVPTPRPEMTAQAMPTQMMDPQGMGGPAQGFVMPQGMPQAPQMANTPMPPIPQQQMQAPSIDPRILQALSDPRVDGNTKRIAAMLLQQQQAQQQAFAEQQALQNDPLRQLQIQKGQLELEAMRNPKPKYEFTTGKDGSIFRTDQAGNIKQVYGGKPDRPVDVQEYEYAVEQMRAAGMPAEQIPDYTTWSTGQKRAGASQVNIDQRAEGAFEKKLAENQATTFDTMATEGLNSRADLALIDELGGLLEGQGGMATGLAGWAATKGFDIGEGTSDLQAAQAIISRLVPTQRQPGSGSMSDRDVELFRASLPSLWNQPGGNQRIIGVMRGLAQYKAAQGEIADSVLAGEMTRQEARRALRELPNPLEGIGKKEEKPISEMTDEELEAIANGNR